MPQGTLGNAQHTRLSRALFKHHLRYSDISQK